MSHDISPGAGPSGSTSPARLSPIISPPHDFTDATGASGLASALQDMAQALLSYSQSCEANAESQTKQSPASQKPLTPRPPIPRNSNRAKRKAKCQACAFDRYAPDAFSDFAGKELAKSFDEAYANGNFRDEIRYYFVPSHIVKYEYRLLHYHQQNNILDMLLAVHTELDIRSKLLAYLTEETSLQGSSLAQISESFTQPLRLLHTLHSHLSKCTLIHKTMLRCPHKQ